MTRPQASPRAIAVARGDEAADLLISGGRVFSPARREFVRHGAGGGRRRRRRLGRAGGAGGGRRGGRRADAGVRGRPHAPRVDEALDRRVRARGAPAWDDRRGRGPARDRKRPGRAGHRGARGGRRAAAVHVRGLCLQLRAGVSVRERRRGSRCGRRARAHRAPRRPRRGGGNELPGRDRRRPGDVGPHRRGRRAARRRSQPWGARPGARRVPGRGGRVRPRVDHPRGGGRAPAQGHVGVHPPGLREPEPRDAHSRCHRARDRPGGLLHRRPGTGHAPAARSHQRLRPAGGGRGGARGRCPRLGEHQPGSLSRLPPPRRPGAGKAGRRALLRRARLLAAGARLAGGPAGGRGRRAWCPVPCPRRPFPS